MPEYEPVEAAHLWPQALFDQFPDTVPMHGITILDALRADGNRAVHVVHDTGAPVWILVGLLKCVLADLEARWIGEGYETDDL